MQGWAHMTLNLIDVNVGADLSGAVCNDAGCKRAEVMSSSQMVVRIVH